MTWRVGSRRPGQHRVARRLATRLARLAVLSALIGVGSAAQAMGCEQAWDAYREFKRRNVMEPTQYPLTLYGAQVRASCGSQALPVPPGSDTPRVVVRRPAPPQQALHASGVRQPGVGGAAIKP